MIDRRDDTDPPARTLLLVLGSNIEPETHLPRATDLLLASFGSLTRSSVYVSPAVGAPGTPDFHNQAIVVESALVADPLRDELRAIETTLGRVRTDDRNAPRTIDIDRVAVFDRDGRALPDPPIDPDLLRFAHLLIPAAEILPQATLAAEGPTLAELAAEFRDLPERFERRLVPGPPQLRRED